MLDFFVQHLPYVTPFWFWVFWGFVASFVAGIIGWGFPVLRGFAATVILTVIAGLSGYRRAQYDTERRYKETHPNE